MGLFKKLGNLLVFIFVKNFFKIFLVVIIAVGLFIFLFPKKELSDFASKTVAEQTRQNVKFDFDDLSFAVSNSFGIKLDRVYLQIAGQQPMNLKQVAASPDLLPVFKHLNDVVFSLNPAAPYRQKPYGKIKVTGLFGGEAEVIVSKHKPEAETAADDKIEQSSIAVVANRMDLTNLKNLLNLPFEMTGQADLNAKVVSILNLAPPVSEDGKAVYTPPFQLLGVPEVTITIKNFDMPPFLLEKGMLMPVNVPALKFSEVVLKGRLYDNTFQIQELTLGKPNDELSGTITGKIMLTKGPLPQLERYEISTNLKFRQSFHDKISLFLTLLKPELIKPFQGGYEFKTKVTGVMYGTPSFGPAQ